MVKWGPAKKALALTVALRVFYSAVAALMSRILSLNPTQIHFNALTDHLMERGDHALLYSLFGVWERFDTLWYIQIARHGYNITQGAVFYPLYPFLIRVFSLFTRWDLLSAILITNVATFLMFWGALRLFELKLSPRNALYAIVLWGLFPGAFVFFSAYPDSLLIALTLWSACFATRGRWTAAGILGFAAGLAKAFGCLTIVPILYLGWRNRDWRSIPAALLSIAGVAAFQLYLGLHHFPSTTQIYEAYWLTTSSAPWFTVAEAFWQLAHGSDSLLALNLGVLLAVMAAGYLARVPVEYRLYCAAGFLLIATKDTIPLFQSSVRYSLALFAAFPAIARRLEDTFNFVAFLLPMLALNLFLLRVYLDWGLVV
jgi:hypothetical protein